MIFNKIHSNVPAALASLEITGLCFDSRAVKAGDLFFAIEGASDGHAFAEVAVKNGAVAAVIQKGHPLEKKLSGLFKTWAVNDTRQALAECAAAFYGAPSEKLKVVGITGTNGKTTSTFLMESVLKEAGLNPAVIGTVECRLGDYKITSTHTTPDSVLLHKLFSDFLNRGAGAVAMEVSSHAIEQKRVWATKFKAAIFTNLTPDHLDYHGDMESYFQAKAKLFLEHEVEVSVVHVKDEYGKRLLKSCQQRGLKVFSFGPSGCDLNYQGLKSSALGISGKLEVAGSSNTITINSKLIGAFNIENIAGVALCGLAMGLDAKQVSSAIAKALPVPGRMELVPDAVSKPGRTVVVDYAHTPDALEKALKALRPLTEKKLYCVFGCGGDRDRQKRPLMGAIAESLADYVILTSDNPRTEAPNEILKQIEAGMKKPSSAATCEVIEDRKAAIQKAVSLLEHGDILLIAGKGHEDYQIIGSEKRHFDDREVASESLKNEISFSPDTKQ